MASCENYSKFEYHMLNNKYYIKDTLYLFNIIFSVLKSIVGPIYDNSVYILCAVIFILILIVINKSYWSPVLIKRVSI